MVISDWAYCSGRLVNFGDLNLDCGLALRARRLGAIVGTNGSTSWLDCSGVGTGVSTCARSAYDLGINDLCRRDRNIASEFGSWSLHATRDSKNHAWHLAGRSRNFILHSYP